MAVSKCSVSLLKKIKNQSQMNTIAQKNNNKDSHETLENFLLRKTEIIKYTIIVPERAHINQNK